MSKDHYVADAPLDSREGDRLRRWPFAERIADTLATRSDPTSLVVGVYGRWGEGKTTVLQFIEQRLKEKHGASVVVVRFNPWLFTDDSDLFLGFFAQVAAAIDRQLESTKGKVGGFLKTYGGIVTGLAGVDLSKVGEELAKSTPQELRDRLETVLAEKKTRIVVLLDDIDRLDKNEAQAVFRLLKVAADFRWTSYVLAFDREVVASALAERYPRRPDGGDEFLDKIIQVPLTLPPVPRAVLRRILVEDLERVLDDAGIAFRPAEGRRFVAALDLWLLTRIDTLRAVKRYVNSLQFALPLVRGEVNAVDFMLIDAIRVFNPGLYSLIIKHRAVLLNQFTPHSEDFKRDIASITGIEPGREARLLIELFPYVAKVLDEDEGLTAGAAEAEWSREKRIASKAHFARYFAAGIAQRDVPDWKVVELIDTSVNRPDQVAADIRQLIDREVDTEGLAQKLFELGSGFSGYETPGLARALAQVGHLFPHSETGLADATSPRAQVALLTASVMANHLSPDQDGTDLATVLRAADLSFAMHVYRWFRSFDSGMDGNYNNLLAEQYDGAGIELAVAIATDAAIEWPLDLGRGEGSRRIWLWHSYGDRPALGRYLAHKITEEPRRALAVIEGFLNPEGDASDTHRVDPGKLMDLAALLGPDGVDLLATALDRTYGATELVAGGQEDASSEARLAQRCLRILRGEDTPHGANK